MSGVDLMPTIAALAGIRCDAPSIDGEDLSSALRGEPAVRQRPLHWEWFFEVVGNPAYFAPPLAVRDGPWKFYCDYAGGNIHAGCHDILDFSARVLVSAAEQLWRSTYGRLTRLPPEP